MKDDKVLSEALDRFRKSQDADKENRDLAAEDFRFAAGQQWPDDILAERKSRPTLTFNRLPQFIAQVVGDARQNKPAIKVHPVDSGADVETAEVYNGLIRNIESQSRATQAYIHAFEHAVTGGMGAWRVLTEYSTDDSFEQDIRIKRIVNPFSVVWDANAREYDKSDAQYCFVSEYITKEAFEQRYPDQVPTDWTEEYAGGTSLTNYWLHEDRVRIAEYWCKKPVIKRIGLWEGKTIELGPDSVPEMFEAVREVKTYKVVRYLLSGHAILEGPSEWAGRYIPIVPVFGPEEWIDDRARYRSLIRYAKDPQRMYNFWQSTIAEKVALAPKSPWLGTLANFAGLQQFWNKANKENRPYLPYNPDPANGGQAPQRQEPAYVNAAELQQSAQSIDDLKATMGMYDASLGNQSNETSGRAILARQREGDNATFAWIDNLARSIQHTGRILVDLIPKIYDTARVVRVLGEDDSAEMAEINMILPDGRKVNDLSVGKYDVEISVGPSYQTKRLEAAESMLAFIQAIPGSAQLAGDLIAKAMDWPGAEAIAERLKKTLPPGLAEEEKDPEAQQALMQQQQEMQAKQQEQDELMKAAAVADIELKRAQTMKAKADASKVLVEAEAQDIENDAVQSGMAGLLDRMNGQDQASAG